MITPKQAKEALGSTGKKMTNQEIVELVSFLDHMTDIAIDKFERNIFGKSLNRLLTEYERKA